MKIMITFLSFLIILAGGISFLGANFPIPHKGTSYSIVLIILGVIIIALAWINQLLIGTEKFILTIEGLFVIFMACLRFLPTLLTIIPREGMLFSLIIIAGGICGFIYGLLGMG